MLLSRTVVLLLPLLLLLLLLLLHCFTFRMCLIACSPDGRPQLHAELESVVPAAVCVLPFLQVPDCLQPRCAVQAAC
jgi:hypothetical protein